jgi:hypothetical protein
MTATLPNRVTAPPGSWRYKVPETNQTFSGPSEQSLIVQLQAHYRANGYPVPSSEDLRPRIEAFICAAVPDYCTGNEPARFVDGFSFHTVIQGTRTFAVWIMQSIFKGGRQFVSQEKANDRAKTCMSCSFNEQPDGCTGCNSGALKTVIQVIIGARSTPYDEHLRACRICNCLLRAKCHLPFPVLYNNMTDKQKSLLPAHCWLVKESKEATP